MPATDCFVSAIAPMADDEDIIVGFVRDTLRVLAEHYENYELVLVDDGSTDRTAALVLDLLKTERCIRLLRLSRRFGRDVAISAGLDTVIGDFAVVLVPESDPPALIPEFIERVRHGDGIVSGVRSRRPTEPGYLRLGSRLFYWYFNRIVGVQLARDSTDYRAYSRQSVNAITRIKDRLRYLRTFGSHVGFEGGTLRYEPVQRRPRTRGRGFGEALALALDMTVANSTRPLRVVSVMGLVMSFVCGVHLVYVMLTRLLDPTVVPGWTTQQAFHSMMFLFLFLILATLCEYVGRLLGEVKDRPLYFVLEERASSVPLANEGRRNVVTDP